MPQDDHLRKGAAPKGRLLSVSPHEVHVWTVALDLCARLESLTSSLDSDEKDRSLRFLRERDGVRYAASHAALRDILSRYLGCGPRDVRLETGSWGKPVLAPRGAAGLSFNMTHAEDVAMIAVAAGREVGVDVEYPRDQVDFAGIAGRFFAPSEAAPVLAAHGAEQVTAFYRIWTRKEALIKATGLGFSIPLDSFAVPPGTLEGFAEIPVPSGQGRDASWLLCEIPAPPPCIAAVAVEGREIPALTRFDYAS